ncbi:MAG TPA: hypothetical protein VL522_07735 [Bordetella sp.]|jgi:hypothetical protein|nr:hypothetical protein [Bordetella sp.]
MSDFGLQDIAYVGSNMLDTNQKAGAGTNPADAAFDQILKNVANARGQNGTSQTDAARRTMADPDQWAATHGAPAGNPAAKSAGADQLSQYLSMPLGKRMFYMVLASMGISQAQYDAMSPADQAKVADQVAQRLKDNAEAQKQVAGTKDAAGVSV